MWASRSSCSGRPCCSRRQSCSSMPDSCLCAPICSSCTTRSQPCGDCSGHHTSRIANLYPGGLLACRETPSLHWFPPSLFLHLGPCRRSGNSPRRQPGRRGRSEEHTSELQSHGLISYAVFCLKKKKSQTRNLYTSLNLIKT